MTIVEYLDARLLIELFVDSLAGFRGLDGRNVPHVVALLRLAGPGGRVLSRVRFLVVFSVVLRLRDVSGQVKARFIGFIGRREWHQNLMDHCILEAHLLIIQRRTEVLLSHELVPFSLRV